MSTMEWKSDFVESFVEQGLEQGREQGLVQGLEQGLVQGLEQGRVQGKREDVVKVLDVRGLRPTEEQRARVDASTDFAQLDRWFERSLTAGTAAEVFTD
jgi:flagellar biosynthesis/type III secretory pathway protein FliH